MEPSRTQHGAIARTVSAVISALVIIGTILVTVTKTVALGDLLIPGAILGIIAVVLGAIAHSKTHIIFGVTAAVFPLLWFLVVVKIFGFV